MSVGILLWSSTPSVRAADRELHWDALDVEARLDAGGVLDVVERHTLVFTGDWNGGERIFNVRPRQKIEFIGLERVDAKTGLRIVISSGGSGVYSDCRDRVFNDAQQFFR